MNREAFWEVLDSAMSAAGYDRAKLPAALREELLGLDEDDVLEFARHFHEARVEAFRWELWAAAWVAGGGASEEDFSDFRDWLVSLGREAFDDALHDPQRLLDHADPAELREPFDSEIGRVAADAYAELTGEEELPSGLLRPHPQAPAGRQWRPGELPRKSPKLWAFYNP